MHRSARAAGLTAWATAKDRKPAPASLRRLSQEELLFRLYGLDLGVSRVSFTGGIVDGEVAVCQATRPFVNAAQVTATQGRGATPEEALCGALLEACERQAGAGVHSSAAVKYISRARLSGRGETALSWQLFGLPADLDDEPFDWLPAVHVDSATPILVPACAVCFPHAESSGRKPALRPSTSGLACGATRVEAFLFALLEVIERHEYSELVCNMNGATRIDLAAVEPDTARIVEKLRRREVQVVATLAPQTISRLVHTVLCFAQDQSGRTRTTILSGSASHPSMAIATRLALTEIVQGQAVQTWGGREDLDRERRTFDDTGAATAEDFERFRRLRQFVAAQPAARPNDSSCPPAPLDAARAIFETLPADIAAHFYARDMTFHGSVPVMKVIAPLLRDVRISPETFVSRQGK